MEAAQYYVVSICNKFYAISDDEVRFFREHANGELHELPKAPDICGEHVWIEPIHEDRVLGRYLGILAEDANALFCIQNGQGLMLPLDGWALRLIAPGEYAVMSDESDD